MKNRFIGANLNNDFEFEKCVPTLEDFEKVSARFAKYRTDGDEATLVNTPSGLVKIIMRDNYKLLRYFVVAMFINYPELVEAAKKVLKTRFTLEEIQKIMKYVKDNAYKFTKYIPTYKYIDGSDKTLAEAVLDPAQQEKKMDAWHNGTRGANISSMSDAKLKMNYDICVRKGYQLEANTLRREGKNRGLSWASQQVPIIQPNKVVISLMELQPIDGQYVLEHANDLNTIVKDCMMGTNPYKEFIKILLLAICLKQNTLVENLKNLLSGSVTPAQLKQQISEIIQDPAIRQRLADIVAAVSVNTNNLQENFERHKDLNKKLFENNKLKPEVKEKVEQIVEEFLSRLQDDEISIDVQDIILVGSNCSYNYTKDSDLDVHIVAHNIEAPENLYEKIYSAYRSIFNKNIEIDFYGIPIEIYVQTENTPMNSNGIYSVMNDSWVKEPVQEDIPEIDQEAFDKEFKVWEDRYNDIIDSGEKELKEYVNIPNPAQNAQKNTTPTDPENFNYYACLQKQDQGDFKLSYLQDLSIDLFGGYEDDDTVESIINNIFSFYKVNKDFEDLLCAFDDDYRAKDFELDRNNLYYYIEGFGEDYGWLLTFFAAFCHDKPGIYNVDVSNRQTGSGVRGQIEVKLDGSWVDKNLIEESINTLSNELDEEIKNKQLDDIEKFIEDIYDLRRSSIAAEGEYSIGNLIFKECRNKGYLDNLKELKNKITGKELSLESLEEGTEKIKDHKWVNRGKEGVHGEFKTKKAADNQRKAMFANGYHEGLGERLDEKQRYDYRTELSQIAFNQVIINDSGLFHIYNIKESDVNRILAQIRNLSYIDWVQKNTGRFDFSKVGVPYGLQPRIYEIYGQIKQ